MIRKINPRHWMNPRIFFHSLLFLLTSCISKSPNNGQTNRPNKIIKRPDTLLNTSSGSMSPYHTVLINNIPFKLVTSSDADTIFLSTDDPRFTVHERFKIGQPWKEIDSKTRENLIIEPGWGYYIPLKSGWNLLFRESSLSGSKYPADSSKITSIFKRK